TVPRVAIGALAVPGIAVPPAFRPFGLAPLHEGAGEFTILIQVDAAVPVGVPLLGLGPEGFTHLVELDGAVAISVHGLEPLIGARTAIPASAPPAVASGPTVAFAPTVARATVS